MLKTLLSILSILIISSSFVACDDNGPSKTPFGSACDATTNCDAICNIGLPDGMCVRPCSDVQPCDEGTCIHFAENADYCVPSCSANDECRDGYACVNDVCRPLVKVGGTCDETTDCLPCDGQTSCPDGKTIECNENICSFTCNDGDECPDNTVCALSSSENWCVPVEFEVGEGTYGDSCSQGTCADGFTCQTTGADDVYAYCSKECTVDRDCPPTMNCRDNGSGTKWCSDRKNCDSCVMDSQCGFQTDKCVTADPAVNADETYCSVKCDPDREGTCPFDFTCLEAFFCADKNAWVSDCAACPTGTCEAGDSATYQCFKDFGSCVGDGNVCEPCKSGDDCSVTGGACVSVEGANNYVCSSPCGNHDICPDNYMCIDAGSNGRQCVPRTGSCSDPSNGFDTCRSCSAWEDCIRGGCLPPDGNMDNATYCLDYCDTNADCGPYASCTDLVIFNQYHFNVCLPNTAVDTCTHWRNCDSSCPDPQTSCSYTYCIDNGSL